MMGPKNKTKGPGKTQKSSFQNVGATHNASPYSTRDHSKVRMVDLDDDLTTSQDELCIDYKQLAAARQISSDIQETLAAMVSNMLSKLQLEVSQHK